MELKVELNASNVERFTTETLSLTHKDKVLFNGAELTPTASEAKYTGFADVGVCILTVKDGVTCYSTVDAVSKEELYWVFVQRTPKTETIFEPFKRSGIYLSTIRCGMNFKTGNLVVQTKLCKELSRCSDVARAELYAYLCTMVQFVNSCQQISATPSVGSGGRYDLGISVAQFADAIPKFEKKDATFYIKDFSSEDLDSVTYHNNNISHMRDTYVTSYPMQFAVAEYGQGKHIAAVVLPVATRCYTFMIMDGTVATDHDLCMLELASDSVCNSIAMGYGSNVQVVHKETASFITKDKFTILPFDDTDVFGFLNGLPAWLKHWCKYNLERGNIYAEDTALKYLQSLGMKLSSDVSLHDPEEIKAQYANDEYAQELYKQTHPYYDSFELGVLNNNVTGFANGAIYSMAYVGESGTGKSTAARVMPTRCGFPYVSVNFSVNIEEADLFGAMIPNPEKKSAEDPEFVWQDGILTRAVRNGYCVVLEEINFARPGVLGKLNSLLDENRQIDLANGEIVKAHPNFRIIATCNIAYEGTNRFNKALINRFDDVTVFKDLERSDAITVIKQRTGYANETKIARVYDVYEALKKFANEQRIHAVVSMRQLLNIFTKGKYYRDAKDAITRIMLNGAFLEDGEYQEVFEGTVLPAFDLRFKL